jgi:PilZ domain
MVQETSYSSERRAAERFRVSLPVESDRGPGVTRDVSLSGLYLVTQEGLSPGDHLNLVVGLAESGSPFPFRLAVRGRVVRVEDADGAVGAAVAVEEESVSLLRAY